MVTFTKFGAQIVADGGGLAADFGAQRSLEREVLYESLRDDIRMLADGFATMSTKLDSLQR